MANTTPTRSSPPLASSDEVSIEPSPPISVPQEQPHILKRQRSTEGLSPALPDATNLPEHTAKKLRAEAPVAKKPIAAPGTFFKSGPQPESKLQSLNSIPFSMAAFRDALTEEEKSLLCLECDTMGRSWLKLLANEIKKPYFLSLKRFLRGEGINGAHVTTKVYPPLCDIYAWSRTPLGRVKVVIIGQDPYFNPGQAHGLCFSVPVGISVPPSLINIYKELKAEYPEFEIPKHGNLMSWAANGVLLLNTSLTVRAGQAGSHIGQGWETFTDKVVSLVDLYGGANLPGANGTGRGVVFLAWGQHAGKKVARLNKIKHLVLTSAHPSPRSADRGFMGNGHFKSANEWLERKYGAEAQVNWCNLQSSIT
ncbi:uracil-DNA glycosylase [Pluteus cervinus]|uniref:Uracil-DNA glycosylase n=1 Tax=Pluteus cervinus TaxID=181527 RepID=A0ACD3B3T2_9AGAR|nr:uracil-DNA glycosylase [Pluteus cervinus]